MDDGDGVRGTFLLNWRQSREPPAEQTRCSEGIVMEPNGRQVLGRGGERERARDKNGDAIPACLLRLFVWPFVSLLFVVLILDDGEPSVRTRLYCTLNQHVQQLQAAIIIFSMHPGLCEQKHKPNFQVHHEFVQVDSQRCYSQSGK